MTLAAGIRLGVYEVVAAIGRGGMGEVYRARDSRLDRDVAIKILPEVFLHDPERVARFQREAKTLAALNHPHIATIHGLEEAGGTQFFVMELVEGETLAQRLRRGPMPIPEVLEIARQVTDALQAAHQKGIIHRDLKPANIALTPEGQVKVLDFGLAKAIEPMGAGSDAPTLTVAATHAGVILGTPAYMPPEQAFGDLHRIDRRSDIYSLGATLYELLAGRPPFQGETIVDVVMQVVELEPVPLRRLHRSIPADLDVIILKCLEKEPQRRYDSAKALAQDLDRYLAGDPILARPSGRVYRVLKKVRKNRVLVTAVALAAVVAVGSASVGIYTWRTSAQRAALAAQFGQEIEEAENLVRQAYLLPPHDTDPVRAQVLDRLKSIRGQMDQLGGVALAPGSYALGRGYLAVGDYQQARQYLEEAWELEYERPETGFALGQVLGVFYQRALEEADRIPSRELREARRTQAERELREPALMYLTASTETQPEPPMYVRALIALYDQRYDDALKSAEESYRTSPSFYEAKKLAGDVHMAVGRQHASRGDYRQALEGYRRAGDAYRAALDIARSAPTVREAECTRWVDTATARMLLAEPPEATLATVDSTCNLATEIRPSGSTAYGRLSLAYTRYAEYLMNRGRDPLPALSRALEHADDAVRLDPADVNGYLYKGTAHRMWAEDDLRLGRDPRPALDAAVASFDSIVRMKNNYPYAHDYLGIALDLKAEYELAHGGDPVGMLEQAVENYQRSIAINPEYSGVHHNLGYAYRLRGEYEYARGRNPEPWFRNAIDSFGRALRINPNSIMSLSLQGYAHTAIGRYLLDRGVDPTDQLTRGRAILQQSIDTNPKLFWIHLDVGNLELIAARWAAKSGHSPLQHFRKAREAMREALRQNPGNPEVYKAFADLDRYEGEWRLQAKLVAGPLIDEGLQFSTKALQLNPNMSTALASRASLLLLNARIAPNRTARIRWARQARKAMEAAFRINRNLEPLWKPLLDEASRIAA